MQHRGKISLATSLKAWLLLKKKADDLQTNYKLRETWFLHEYFLEHLIKLHWNKIQTLSYYQLIFKTVPLQKSVGCSSSGS